MDFPTVSDSSVEILDTIFVLDSIHAAERAAIQSDVSLQAALVDFLAACLQRSLDLETGQLPPGAECPRLLVMAHRVMRQLGYPLLWDQVRAKAGSSPAFMRLIASSVDYLLEAPLAELGPGGQEDLAPTLARTADVLGVIFNSSQEHHPSLAENGIGFLSRAANILVKLLQISDDSGHWHDGMDALRALLEASTKAAEAGVAITFEGALLPTNVLEALDCVIRRVAQLPENLPPGDPAVKAWLTPHDNAYRLFLSAFYTFSALGRNVNWEDAVVTLDTLPIVLKLTGDSLQLTLLLSSSPRRAADIVSANRLQLITAICVVAGDLVHNITRTLMNGRQLGLRDALRYNSYG